MNIRKAPIFMFQWSPSTELNELESIEDRFNDLGPAIVHPEELRAATAGEAFRESIVRERVGYPGDAIQDWLLAEAKVTTTFQTHDIASFRMTEPDGSLLIAQLGSLLETWDNAQTLYFSCHGTRDLLSFDDGLTSVLSFQDFGSALSRLRQDCVTLVLGCCYGLNHHSAVLPHIPEQISEIYGFTGTPRSSDVASLMLGVLLDQARLFRNISDLNTSTCGTGVHFDDEWDAAAARMGAVLDRILDTFQEDPSQHVRGMGGVGVRWLRRVDYNDQSVWQGRTIPLSSHSR